MFNTVSDLFYATVAYADIFAYALTDEDVYYWFIQKIPKRNIRHLQIKGVVKRGRFIVLKKRESIISNLKRRAGYSHGKWEVARRVGRYLRIVPTIKLVGVTGGLAMRNTERKDDIDFFIITARNTLWVSRLIAVCILDMFHLRRKPGEKNVKNKICLNMFMSEDALQLPKTEQDLFAAHEVLQMEPLWARGNIYKTFLLSNNWVKEFLPVAWNIKKTGYNIHPKYTYWWSRMGIEILQVFENPTRIFQLWYMRKRITKEVVDGKILRFHPRDTRDRVRREFAKRLNNINMPLDNIFYAR